MFPNKNKLNDNLLHVISISSCWLFLVVLNFFVVGCQSPTDSTALNVDREIPPSEAFDASYGFWGPDGEVIYFTHSKELGSNPDPGQLDQLWKLTLETGNRQMIHTGRILHADISPNGKWFVFNSFAVPQYLYKMNSNGTDLQRLTGPDTSYPDWKYTINGKWSPDNQHILFSLSAGTPRGVSLMDKNGTSPEIIIPFGIEPNWSPNGDQVIYLDWDTTKVPKNQEQIYIADADGKNFQRITNLTNTYFNIHDPIFSPDGLKITYTHDDEIYIINADGSNIEQLTEGPGYAARPEWSPDGEIILFSRIIQNVSKRLYFLDVASREVTPVFPLEEHNNSN